MALTYLSGGRIQGLSTDTLETLTLGDDFSSDNYAHVSSGTNVIGDVFIFSTSDSDERGRRSLSVAMGSDDFLIDYDSNVGSGALGHLYASLILSENDTQPKVGSSNDAYTVITTGGGSSKMNVLLSERNGGSDNQSSSSSGNVFNVNTVYFFRLTKVGTTLKIRGYATDSNRNTDTSVIGTVSLTLTGGFTNKLDVLQHGSHTNVNTVTGVTIDNLSIYNGVSSLTPKPTDVPIGTRFEETDTRKIFRSIATASLTDLTWVSEKDISGSHDRPTGLWFKPDGEEFYVVDEGSNTVTQWSMSTANAWDITNASLTSTENINSQEAIATGIALSSDGTKLYVCGVAGQDTNQYTLTTPWALGGTVTHNGTHSDSGRDNAPYDITIGDSGTKFYILGMQHEKIYQYSLAVANVITSGVTYVTEYDGSSEWSNVTDATFTSDGKKMFVIDQTHDKIFEYALKTAWNVSTASLTRNSSYSSKDNEPHGIQIGNSDENLFILGWQNDKVHRYTCGVTEWVEKGTA